MLGQGEAFNIWRCLVTSRQTGPDHQDVQIYLKHLKDHHDATVKTEIVLDTAAYGAPYRVTMAAHVPVFVGAGRTYSATVTAFFPCVGHKTLASLLYWLCHRLDNQLAKDVWKQSGLPE